MNLALAALASLAMMTVPRPTSPDVYDGRPRFDQGDAYYFWKDGGKWHLRWVAAERAREFKGVVAVTGGILKSVEENDSEKEALAFLSSLRRLTVSMDRADPGLRVPDAPSVNRATIRQDGTDKIVFEARTTNSIGGFDFVTRADANGNYVLDVAAPTIDPDLIALADGLGQIRPAEGDPVEDVQAAYVPAPIMRTPATAPTTWRMMPPLPEVSMPWMTSSTERFPPPLDSA